MTDKELREKMRKWRAENKRIFNREKKVGAQRSLTNAQILEIHRLSETYTDEGLAKRYGVSARTVANIRTGNMKGYRAIILADNPKAKFYKRPKITERSTLSEESVAQIKREGIEENLKPHEIAKKYGVSRQIVYAITSGRTWKHVEPAPVATI